MYGGKNSLKSVAVEKDMDYTVRYKGVMQIMYKGKLGSILVVDDEPAVLESSSLLLKEYGFEVVSSSSAEDAIGSRRLKPRAIASRCAISVSIARSSC